MSTLVAQTISNGTVSTSSANVIQGSAKAWVNFNGTGTVAIRASYNVSSITDNGTGAYTINFTNAMPDANYCTHVTVGGASTGQIVYLDAGSTTYPTQATSNVAIRIREGYLPFGFFDVANANVSILR
jgi:hypothetical protein